MFDKLQFVAYFRENATKAQRHEGLQRSLRVTLFLRVFVAGNI
jgi:hypothetical protein